MLRDVSSDTPLHVGHRRRIAQRHVPQVLPAVAEVDVAVDQAGSQQLALQVDLACPRAAVPEHGILGADREDAPAANGNVLRPGLAGIDRVHPAVQQQEIRGPRRANGGCAECRDHERRCASQPRHDCSPRSNHVIPPGTMAPLLDCRQRVRAARPEPRWRQLRDLAVQMIRASPGCSGSIRRKPRDGIA